jgi:hypothetical protein
MSVVLHDANRGGMTPAERSVYEMLLPHIAKAIQVQAAMCPR